MKRTCIILAAGLTMICLPLLAGNVEMKFSGPSGQGDLIWKAPASGVTNMAMGTSGLYNVTFDPAYPVTIYDLAVGGAFTAGSVSNLEAATNALNDRMGSVEGGTNALNDRMAAVEAGTNANLTLIKANQAATNALNTRMAAVEAGTNANLTLIKVNQAATNSLNDRMASVEGGTNALNDRMALVEAGTNANLELIKANQAATSSLNVAVGALNSATSTLNTAKADKAEVFGTPVIASEYSAGVLISTNIVTLKNLAGDTITDDAAVRFWLTTAASAVSHDGSEIAKTVDKKDYRVVVTNEGTITIVITEATTTTNKLSISVGPNVASEDIPLSD